MKKHLKNQKAVTLIALVITIIVLLILVAISIATLTGENGILHKATQAKEAQQMNQYKEEINLIILEEIAQRKVEAKEELMKVSLDRKIREKKWVNEIYKCNSNGEEQQTFETSTHLLVESKEYYEFLIEVNEEQRTAKIVSTKKGTGEKYKITYNPNEGVGQEETVEIRQGFSLILKDCNYTRENYKFVGWSENQNGEGERYLSHSIYKPTGEVTLYAIWELNVVTITFNSNDGTGKTEQVTVTKGKETKLPENSFTRKGYKFLEWNTKTDRTGTKYENGANINVEQDTTLYAIWKEPSTVGEAKEKEEPLSTTENIKITDDFGNQVTIPAGFKIATESATNVTGGVVIEDVSHTETKESEFVWIPVGKIYTDVGKTESKARVINLSRYTFAKDGKSIAQGGNIITINMKEEYGEENGYPDVNIFFNEVTSSSSGNAVALNINEFKTSVDKNGGYYIGRYEARTGTKRNSKTDALKQVTVKKTDFVYNYVTQPQATERSQGMYNKESRFTSDLMNSYAYDTALEFLQTFDDRTKKTKLYSKEHSVNTGSVATKGTNNMEKASQDKICNIWDMASNIKEHTTESYLNDTSPCTSRGGSVTWYAISFTAGRYGGGASDSGEDVGFRPIIYL